MGREGIFYGVIGSCEKNQRAICIFSLEKRRKSASLERLIGFSAFVVGQKTAN